MKQKLLQEEKRLQSLGIIEDVPENVPTTWVTNPVIAPKPNNPDDIRYCTNMRPPNKAIKRPITEVPSVEDIVVKLNGSTVFSKLDMSKGYHQIELEEELHHVTTSYGVNGKKRYTRLNYGTMSSQDIFDNIMTKTTGDIPGVLHILDDILVHGKTQSEHNAALLALLRRSRECNLTLRKSKCKFNLSEINFFEFIFSADGMKHDPEKVDTVRFMDPPTNGSEVHSFISMAAFLS